MADRQETLSVKAKVEGSGDERYLDAIIAALQGKQLRLEVIADIKGGGGLGTSVGGDSAVNSAKQTKRINSRLGYLGLSDAEYERNVAGDRSPVFRQEASRTAREVQRKFRSFQASSGDYNVRYVGSRGDFPSLSDTEYEARRGSLSPRFEQEARQARVSDTQESLMNSDRASARSQILYGARTGNEGIQQRGMRRMRDAELRADRAKTAQDLADDAGVTLSGRMRRRYVQGRASDDDLIREIENQQSSQTQRAQEAIARKSKQTASESERNNREQFNDTVRKEEIAKGTASQSQRMTEARKNLDYSTASQIIDDKAKAQQDRNDAKTAQQEKQARNNAWTQATDAVRIKLGRDNAATVAALRRSGDTAGAEAMYTRMAAGPQGPSAFSRFMGGGLLGLAGVDSLKSRTSIAAVGFAGMQAGAIGQQYLGILSGEMMSGRPDIQGRYSMSYGLGGLALGAGLGFVFGGGPIGASFGAGIGSGLGSALGNYIGTEEQRQQMAMRSLLGAGASYSNIRGTLGGAGFQTGIGFNMGTNGMMMPTPGRQGVVPGAIYQSGREYGFIAGQYEKSQALGRGVGDDDILPGGMTGRVFKSMLPSQEELATSYSTLINAMIEGGINPNTPTKTPFPTQEEYTSTAQAMNFTPRPVYAPPNRSAYVTGGGYNPPAPPTFYSNAGNEGYSGGGYYPPSNAPAYTRPPVQQRQGNPYAYDPYLDEPTPGDYANAQPSFFDRLRKGQQRFQGWVDEKLEGPRRWYRGMTGQTEYDPYTEGLPPDPNYRRGGGGYAFKKPLSGDAPKSAPQNQYYPPTDARSLVGGSARKSGGLVRSPLSDYAQWENQRDIYRYNFEAGQRQQEGMFQEAKNDYDSRFKEQLDEWRVKNKQEQEQKKKAEEEDKKHLDNLTMQGGMAKSQGGMMNKGQKWFDQVRERMQGATPQTIGMIAPIIQSAGQLGDNTYDILRQFGVVASSRYFETLDTQQEYAGRTQGLKKGLRSYLQSANKRTFLGQAMADFHGDDGFDSSSLQDMFIRFKAEEDVLKRRQSLDSLAFRNSGALQRIDIENRMELVGRSFGTTSQGYQELRHQWKGAVGQKWQEEDALGYNMDAMKLSNLEERAHYMPYTPGLHYGAGLIGIGMRKNRMGQLNNRMAFLRQQGVLSEQDEYAFQSQIEGLQTQNAQTVGMISEGALDRIPALSAGTPGGFRKFDSWTLAAMNLGMIGSPMRRFGAGSGAQANFQDSWVRQMLGTDLSPKSMTSFIDSSSNIQGLGQVVNLLQQLVYNTQPAANPVPVGRSNGGLRPQSGGVPSPRDVPVN